MTVIDVTAHSLIVCDKQTIVTSSALMHYPTLCGFRIVFGDQRLPDNETVHDVGQGQDAFETIGLVDNPEPVYLSI